MSVGTVDEVRAYRDELVTLFEDAPAYFMAHGCYFENTSDEKLRAFIEFVKNRFILATCAACYNDHS